jgi:hypothetical protein
LNTRRLDLYTRCADALGSLQFDLIDAQKHNSVLTDALDNSTRLLHEEAKRLEPSDSAWVVAGQWIGNNTQRRRLAKMFDDFARQAVANSRR